MKPTSQMTYDVVSYAVRERLSEMIKEKRVEAGLTQTELAKRAGTSRGHILKLERVEGDMPTLRTICKIASVFGLPVQVDFPDWGSWIETHMEDLATETVLEILGQSPPKEKTSQAEP